MKVITIPPDEGFANLVVGEATITIDVVRTNNRLFAIQNAHAGDENIEARHEAMADYFQTFGIPKPSHRLTTLIANAIIDAYEELTGKTVPAQNTSPSPA